MNPEQSRADQPAWKTWGPYITDRQWGTVREDYSSNGDAWEYLSHDAARSKAFRWGEEGIAGICDEAQQLCFAISLWNKKDPILKERYFGLTGNQGNHGEDVKELYYYLENTPSHSYMKMLYKYPQQAFPYEELLKENNRRTKADPEYELIDTGIFDDNAYFDVFVEYAKADTTDILIKITVVNQGSSTASLHVLPTIWFRNTWSWGYDEEKPQLMSSNDGEIIILHKKLGNYTLRVDQKTQVLFCENETNNQKLYNAPNSSKYCKDGIHEYLVNGNEAAVNINAQGTKAALNYELEIPAGGNASIRLRLTENNNADNAFS
ncbi:MAG: glucosidase, partial [Bacteroidota bacterium]|nr:glucosidase [Bacteroidota bacterium]